MSASIIPHVYTGNRIIEETGSWFGFKCEQFEFEGRLANIVFPEKPNSKKSWTLKTEYRDAFPESEIELLKRGYHVTFIKNRTRWATKDDCDLKAKFIKHISEKYGLSKKCTLIGMSCGGCHAVNLAGFYPELISCLFIDGPVLNFMDYPCNFSKPSAQRVWENEFVVAYPGIKRAHLTYFDNHPLGKVPVLIENKIPVLLAYGTDDTTVSPQLNANLMEELYEDHPGLLTVMVRGSHGHHPHGFPSRPDIIADYIDAHI